MIKLLSRKPILQKQLFQVFEDEVELPNGARRVYHNVQRNPAVSIFPLTDEHEVYLIKQHRYLYDDVLLEGIAGFIDEGEEPEQTARRELKEETGITAQKIIQFGTMQAAGSIVTWSHPLFVAKGLSFGDTAMEESEDIEVLKMPLSKAVKLVLDGEIKTGASMIGILMLNQLVSNGTL